eukprot:5685788-Prymnesium_polylepis.1
MKPSCDGRSNKSIAQRGIIGFEPRATRGANYIYNPDCNPNLLDLPAKLPVHVELNCEWDQQTDLRNGEIESDYRKAFQAYIESTPSASKHDKAVRIYLCTHCKVPKRGHVCPKAAPPKKRKGSATRSAVKRARK